VPSKAEGWPPAATDAAELDGEVDLDTLEEGALARRADLLAANGRFDEAVAALRTLSSRTGDPTCRHRTRIVRALRAGGHETQAVRELNEMLQTYDAKASRCGNEIARLLLELGDDWVARVAPRNGATDKEAIDLAEQAYRRVLATFQQAELDAWGMCVSLAEIRHTRAELLLLSEKWNECAVAFDEAIVGAVSSARANDAALGAVVCHHHAWSTWREALEREPLLTRIEDQIEDTARWKRLLGSYRRFLCIGQGRASEKLAADKLGTEVALSRAEAFYNGGALWEAAVGFRGVAFEDAGSRAGLRAARRYADVMDNLAADSGCRLQLTQDLERLYALHCSGRAHPEGCGELRDAVARAGGLVPR
jgi:hypothetical protein